MRARRRRPSLRGNGRLLRQQRADEAEEEHARRREDGAALRAADRACVSDRWVLRRRCDFSSRFAPIDATAVRSEDELRRAASGVSGRCKRYEGPARPYLLGYGCCCQLPLVYRLANTRRAAMQSVAAVEAASVL